MQYMNEEVSMRKTLANYEKIGVRRMARAERFSKRNTKFYLDLTNLWRTNSQDQNKQYQAIRDSDLFSDNRAITFLKFNYRNYEPGTQGYGSAFQKVKRKGPSKLRQKGTMQVTDLWGDEMMQQVMGSPTFPRDRLKILRVWGKKAKSEMPLVKDGNNKRVSTVPF